MSHRKLRIQWPRSNGKSPDPWVGAPRSLDRIQDELVCVTDHLRHAAAEADGLPFSASVRVLQEIRELCRTTQALQELTRELHAEVSMALENYPSSDAPTEGA